MKPRTGSHVTAHKVMNGVVYGRPYGGPYRIARDTAHPLKLVLQNSRQRKAPITLATSPLDHRDDRP